MISTEVEKVNTAQIQILEPQPGHTVIAYVSIEIPK